MTEKVQSNQKVQPASSSKPAQPRQPGQGKVYLIGAGPGDPDLITVRGLKALQSATCVIFDALANPLLLNHVNPNAEFIDAGKRAKHHKLTQDETNALLIEKAKAGHIVARLKGGDPYVFGRGSEEGIILHQNGINVEMIPGITAAMAGPAYAGIPVTHRNIATSVTFITGHENPEKDETQTDYEGLARLAIKGGTLCFYMGMARLKEIITELNRHGLSLDTPGAVVQWGTMPKQRSVKATLANLHEAVSQAGLGAPAIIVVGGVAAVDEDDALAWFEKRPLLGQRIIVTRTRHQASDLAQQLTDLGAEVLQAPTIQIHPPDDWAQVDQTIQDINQYDWLILTSTNGVDGLKLRLDQLELDARHLHGVKIAAVGKQTAQRLKDIGLNPDLIPTDFVGESLAAHLIANEDLKGRKILMLRADIARPMLRETLEHAGAHVDDLAVYQTRIAESLPESVIEALENNEVDWITFTSSSTVKNFVQLLPDHQHLIHNPKLKIASIGPQTTQTAESLGLNIITEADPHTIVGLVDALCAKP